ncbi:MAG: bifunctional riboflavin kinase/FAD synthetase [Chloroflexota bacterium]
MIVQRVSEIPASTETGCSVAIGTFDGVHLGHRRLLEMTVADARSHGRESVVLTFDPHPLHVLRPVAAPRLLMTPEDRAEHIGALGVDRLVMLEFTRGLANEAPADFVRRHIVEELKAKMVFVGFNFTYGRHGEGTPERLRSLGVRLGFGVEILAPVVSDGHAVSSTAVRQAVMSGEMESAAAMLTRPYFLPGVVVHGDGRGRTLGFPTANVAAPDTLVRPRPGVYVVQLSYRDQIAFGVANIGHRPTFKGQDLRLEVHLLERTLDLYDQRVRVHFIHYLRPERAFRTAAELQAQINSDIRAALAVRESGGSRLQAAVTMVE